MCWSSHSVYPRFAGPMMHLAVAKNGGQDSGEGFGEGDAYLCLGAQGKEFAPEPGPRDHSPSSGTGCDTQMVHLAVRAWQRRGIWGMVPSQHPCAPRLSWWAQRGPIEHGSSRHVHPHAAPGSGGALRHVSHPRTRIRFLVSFVAPWSHCDQEISCSQLTSSLSVVVRRCISQLCSPRDMIILIHVATPKVPYTCPCIFRLTDLTVPGSSPLQS